MNLTISDDGVGIPATKDVEGDTRDGIGLQLIRGFSRQLGAILVVEEDQGTHYAVRLRREAQPRHRNLDGAEAGQDNAV